MPRSAAARRGWRPKQVYVRNEDKTMSRHRAGIYSLIALLALTAAAPAGDSKSLPITAGPFQPLPADGQRERAREVGIAV